MCPVTSSFNHSNSINKTQSCFKVEIFPPRRVPPRLHGQHRRGRTSPAGSPDTQSEDPGNDNVNNNDLKTQDYYLPLSQWIEPLYYGSLPLYEVWNGSLFALCRFLAVAGAVAR